MAIGIAEVVSGILGPIFKIVDKAVPDATEANRIKGEIEKTVLENQSKLMDTMREIAVAEISGTKYQSYWRPTLAWMVITMWPYNYIARPMVNMISGVDLPEIPETALATVTTVFSTVYGLGRSFEKTGSSISIMGKKNGRN